MNTRKRDAYTTFIPENSIPVKTVNCVPTNALSGDEAKFYYDNLIAPSEMEAEKTNRIVKADSKLPGNKLHKRNDTKSIDKNWFSKAMKFAQNNDVIKLSELLTHVSDEDVNTRDEFGWTLLMCAVCSRSEACVTYLIGRGVDTSVKDKSGLSAVDIAYMKKYYDMVKILQLEPNFDLKNTGLIISKNNEFPCKDCKQVFKNSEESHLSSTVHLLNTSPNIPTGHCIPESNVGFQMLLRSGWNKEQGLGPKGDGRKFPLKVKMKKDRRGIGNTVKIKTRNVSIDVQINPINKPNNAKQMERNFRLEFQ